MLLLNALWIIGNGFDLNVGLRTGYRHFLDDVYLKDGDHSEQRERLIKLVGEDPKLTSGTCWSDLEGLLARTTSKCPEQISERDFSEIFQEMQRLFVEKAAAEQERLVTPLPEEALAEFWDSIVRVSNRMRPRDGRDFPCNTEARENIVWEFISLNYTKAFDAFLREAVKAKGPNFKRSNNGGTYTDSVGKTVFHPHGNASVDTDRMEIIFGASSPEQFEADNPASFELLQELWVKPNKNREVYGNEKTERLADRISKAQVFLLYGVSLGDSDRYIWEMIGKRMAEAAAWTVIFEHELPPSGSQDSMQYLDKRREAREKFLDVVGIGDESREDVQNRIILVSSGECFRFGGMKLLKGDSDVS